MNTHHKQYSIFKVMSRAQLCAAYCRVNSTWLVNTETIVRFKFSWKAPYYVVLFLCCRAFITIHKNVGHERWAYTTRSAPEIAQSG